MLKTKLKNNANKTSKLSLPTTTRQMNSQLKQRLSHVRSVYKQIRYPVRVGSGQTVQFLHSRKENQLNSRFNVRKNNLLQITQENKKIHQRINSQESRYSARNLNKSYDSICSRNSRVSNNSRTSKKSIRTKSMTRKNKQSQLRVQQIKPKNIENMGISDMKEFQKLFLDKINPVKRVNKTEQIVLCQKDQNFFNPIIQERQSLPKHTRSCAYKSKSQTRLPKARPPLPFSKKGIQLPKITEMFERKQRLSRH